jgi:sugar lactone lactonase YvrE
LSFDTNFPEVSGDASACTAPLSLSPGHACDVPVEFEPQVANNGSDNTVTGDAVLTDNALNAAGTQQGIYLFGRAAQPETEFVVTGPATVVQDVPFVITVTYYLNGKIANYPDTVDLSSTDFLFVYPGPLQLVNGVGHATVTLGTPGDQSIDVYDPNNPAVDGGGNFPVLAASTLGTVTYTGSAASANFGSRAVGSTSAARTFSFSLTSGISIGSIEVVTQGAPNLDFTSATGGTCAAATYTSATTCTVNVTFAPMYAGPRTGAIVFYSGAAGTGLILGSVPLAGTGTGPQIAYSPSAVTGVNPEVDGDLIENAQAAVFDGAGNLFVALAQDILKVPADGSTPTVVLSAQQQSNLDYGSSVVGLAVDGAGNLYASANQPSYDTNPLFMIAPNGVVSILHPVANGEALYNGIGAIALDGAGDLYIADSYNHRIVEVPADGTAPTAFTAVADGVAFKYVEGLAVDSAGDIYASDTQNNRVVEFKPGGATVVIKPTVNGLALNFPSSIAVDVAGNLFIADAVNTRIVEVPVSGPPVAINPSLDGNPMGEFLALALSPAGDLAIGNGWPNVGVGIIHRSQAPALSFATATGIGATDKADGTEQVQIQNIGNEPLAFSAVTFPADFTASTGYSNECTGSTSIGAGQDCILRVNFLPENTGPLSENVMLTDNALNVPGAQQAIGVTGTGVADHAATLTSPTPGTTLTGTSITFGWTGGVGVQSYQLIVGTWGVGAGNIFHTYYIPGNATSMAVTIPADGVTLHVRLMQELDGVWQQADYTYTEPGTSAAAVITSPANGSTLSATNVTFSWPGGKGPYEYQLRVGTTGPGSSNVYDSPGLFTTAQTVSVPANGVTLFVRLAQQLNGAWQTADYTYIEPGSPTPATVTSPAPGSTFTSSSVTFNWAGGAGPIAYQFLVGTHGVGSGNLLNTYQTHATSATVTIPANGEKIWVRLNQEISGVWSSTDYTYTADSTP